MQTQPPSSGSATLTHWGVIRAQGADAAMFLHSQLTHDFSQLGLSQARLAAFCSAKGRMQASFVAWKTSPDDVLLACSASVLPATLKRLSMFVLRAKCKLSDATAEVPLHGAIGDSARALLGDAKPWEKRWDKHEAGGRTLIRLPDALGSPRALFVGAPVGAPSLPLDTWRWLEVHSGIPTIEAATVDQFVPQMLNFELIDGVDFKKGCYPGQEVVARSQYRGTIKRRMFVFDIDDGLAAAGQEVFDPADPGQPAGLVVQAAPTPGAAGSSALVEVKLAALEPGRTLHLGAPDGPLLRRVALPYDVPFEAAEPG